MSDQGAYVTINGQQALKRLGDSLDWSGSLGSGVTADLKLRVVLYNESELRLVGTAKIVIDGVSSKQGSIPTSSVIEFSGPVAYGLAKGAFLPGTTLTYMGHSSDGAQMGGVEGYAYRKVGDSIFWEGSLRDGRLFATRRACGAVRRLGTPGDRIGHNLDRLLSPKGANSVRRNMSFAYYAKSSYIYDDP